MLEGQFDWDGCGERIASGGQPLAALDGLILWEQFRPVLVQALSYERRRGAAVYEHLDPVLLFKAAILKELYRLTDIELDRQVVDRMSFQRFLGLSVGELDAHALSRCLGNFLGILRWQGLLHPLFDRFYDLLSETGVQVEKGQIRDIELVAQPAGTGWHRRVRR